MDRKTAGAVVSRYDDAVRKAIPGESFGEQLLRQQLARLNAVSEAVERQMVEISHASKEFLENDTFDDPYFTDNLLSTLAELGRQLVKSAHSVASIRGQIETLRMDRLAVFQSEIRK
jgi:hypothetical protein